MSAARARLGRGRAGIALDHISRGHMFDAVERAAEQYRYGGVGHLLSWNSVGLACIYLYGTSSITCAHRLSETRGALIHVVTPAYISNLIQLDLISLAL